MKQTKSNFVFEKIKSDYFLMKLLDIMKKNRIFEIMKYNKKLQKRLNLNINPLTSPGEVVTAFTYPYLSAGDPTLG